MKMENKDQLLIKEVEFKNQVFASDPDLYRRMFLESPPVAEDEITWEVPQTEGDVQRMLAELRELGIGE